MRSFLVLIKKEWWEWKNLIFWITGIYLFIMLLLLVPISRISNHIDPDKLRLESIDKDAKWDNSIDSDSTQSMITIHVDDDTRENISLKTGYSFGLIAGMQFIQLILLFISLFYFADSLYGERMDSSTLFIRSQPINDHSVLLSKIVSGVTGMILVSLVMSIIFLVFIKSVVWIFGFNHLDVYEIIKNGVYIFDLYKDMAVYQFVSILWLSPFLLFLMLVSASVKKRPLIVGIGSPILLTIMLMILFNNRDLIVQLFGIIGKIKDMAAEQLLIHENTIDTGEKLELFGSFTGYIFSIRSAVSLLIAGIFYSLALLSYRRNIPTS